MINFLYISYFFPPLGGAEPRHNLGWIRGLYDKGYIPTIITTQTDVNSPKDNYLYALIPEKLKIKRIRWINSPNKYMNKFREIAKFPENPLLFKRSQILLKSALKEISQKDFKFIYSVHGIGTAHLAAMKAKKKTGLPWIAEFRDPWFHNYILMNYLEDKSWGFWYSYQLKKTKILLTQVVENADLIVVESPMHGELLIKDFGVNKNKVVPYGMGYDEDYFAENVNYPINFTQKPVIGFVGSVYYGYEDAVKNLIIALKELENKGIIFTFVSVGGASAMFSKYAQEMELKSFIPIDRISLSNALSLMKKINFGVVGTFSKHKPHINSKLWEYLKSDLSILAIVPEDGAMAKIVNEGRCGYILPYNSKQMIPVLEKALQDYKKGEILLASQEFITRFSKELMIDKLADKIKQII